MAEHQGATEGLTDLKVQQANVEAQRARVTAEAGPVLYLAKLFGSKDTEAALRLSTVVGLHRNRITRPRVLSQD